MQRVTMMKSNMGNLTTGDCVTIKFPSGSIAYGQLSFFNDSSTEGKSFYFAAYTSILGDVKGHRLYERDDFTVLHKSRYYLDPQDINEILLELGMPELTI